MAEEDHTAGGDNEPTVLDNVVQFPRDWFGPIEDLVPFGPDHEPTRAAQPKPPVEPTPMRPRGITAEHFWGAGGWDGDWEAQAALTDEQAATTAADGLAAAQTQQQSQSASGRNRARALAAIAIALVAIAGAALPRLTASNGTSANAAPTALADSSTTVTPAGTESAPAASSVTLATSRQSGSDTQRHAAPNHTTNIAGHRSASRVTVGSRRTSSSGGASGPAASSSVGRTDASQTGTPNIGGVAAGSQTARPDYPAAVAPNPSYVTAATP